MSPHESPPPPHQSQSSRRRNGRCRSHRGRPRRRAGERGPTANGRSAQPGLRPQRPDLQPRHSPGRDPGALDALADQQRDNEMGSSRHAVYFLPGDYGTAEAPLQFEVGYYTEVAGLGASPDDVNVNGAIEVYNRCLADGGTRNCLALVNFWRTISNLSLQVNKAGQDGCRPAPTSGRCRRRSRCAASRSPARTCR